jgi:hypothetical protein
MTGTFGRGLTGILPERGPVLMPPSRELDWLTVLSGESLPAIHLVAAGRQRRLIAR